MSVKIHWNQDIPEALRTPRAEKSIAAAEYAIGPGESISWHVVYGNMGSIEPPSYAFVYKLTRSVTGEHIRVGLPDVTLPTSKAVKLAVKAALSEHPTPMESLEQAKADVAAVMGFEPGELQKVIDKSQAEIQHAELNRALVDDYSLLTPLAEGRPVVGEGSVGNTIHAKPGLWSLPLQADKRPRKLTITPEHIGKPLPPLSEWPLAEEDPMPVDYGYAKSLTKTALDSTAQAVTDEAIKAVQAEQESVEPSPEARETVEKYRLWKQQAEEPKPPQVIVLLPFPGADGQLQQDIYTGAHFQLQPVQAGLQAIILDEDRKEILATYTPAAYLRVQRG